METIFHLSSSIYVAQSGDRGRGVFTKEKISKDTLIEVSPVIVMSGSERFLIDQTLLHDYIFEWGEKQDQCCMALGFVPIYNHRSPSNCEYEMDFKRRIISVRSVKNIAKGEELFINYNGDWNSKKRVWFEWA